MVRADPPWSRGLRCDAACGVATALGSASWKMTVGATRDRLSARSAFGNSLQGSLGARAAGALDTSCAPQQQVWPVAG